MQPVKYVWLYLFMVVVFFIIDMIWLGVVARNFYRDNLGHLMLDSPNWPVAIGFYLLYVFGVMVLATLPAAETASASRAILYGALFGLVAYGTYDLTNLATLKDWSRVVTAVDLVWGAVLTGTVSTAGYFAARYLGWPNS